MGEFFFFTLRHSPRGGEQRKRGQGSFLGCSVGDSTAAEGGNMYPRGEAHQMEHRCLLGMVVEEGRHMDYHSTAQNRQYLNDSDSRY